MLSVLFPSRRAQREGARRFFPAASYHQIGVCIAVADLLLIVSASLLSALAYYVVFFPNFPNFRQYLGIGLLSGLVFVLTCAAKGGYTVPSLTSFKVQRSKILLAWLLVILACAVVLFLFKNGADYSRGALSIFIVIGFSWILAARYVSTAHIATGLASGDLSAPPSLTIADWEYLQANPPAHILRNWGVKEIARIVLPNGESGSEDSEVINSALQTARKYDIKSVILVMNWAQKKRRESICERLQALPVTVLLAPDHDLAPLLAGGVRQLGSGFAVEIQRAPLSLFELAIKRTLDVGISMVALLWAILLIGIACVLIRLESAWAGDLQATKKGI